jgi:fumarate reductase flavoprotein subunit
MHDVAIVGAGLAGLTAGARLAERGARVVVLEKGAGEDYPCNVRISGGVFHICFRHINYDEAGLSEVIARNTQGAARADLTSVVARHTKTAVQWFKDKGARFERAGTEKFREMTLAAPPARSGQVWQGHGGGELMRILTWAPAQSGCAWKANAASGWMWSSRAGPSPSPRATSSCATADFRRTRSWCASSSCRIRRN